MPASGHDPAVLLERDVPGVVVAGRRVELDLAVTAEGVVERTGNADPSGPGGVEAVRPSSAIGLGGLVDGDLLVHRNGLSRWSCSHEHRPDRTKQHGRTPRPALRHHSPSLMADAPQEAVVHNPNRRSSTDDLPGRQASKRLPQGVVAFLELG